MRFGMHPQAKTENEYSAAALGNNGTKTETNVFFLFLRI